MIMVTYEFYTDTYLGTSLGEKEFPPLAARAQEVLARFERCYRVDCPGQDSRAMAICAMAETLKEQAKRRNLASATVGGVSVRYENSSSRSLDAELYRRAGVYLDIYRGVG